MGTLLVLNFLKAFTEFAFMFLTKKLNLKKIQIFHGAVFKS
jgi:hypothetical protein